MIPYIPSAPFYHLLWIFLGVFVVGTLFAIVAGVIATTVKNLIDDDERDWHGD